jgi:hypothetical protein
MKHNYLKEFHRRYTKLLKSMSSCSPRRRSLTPWRSMAKSSVAVRDIVTKRPAPNDAP